MWLRRRHISINVVISYYSSSFILKFSMAERKPITTSRAMYNDNNNNLKKLFRSSLHLFFCVHQMHIIRLVYPTSGISGTSGSHWSCLLYTWLRYCVQNYRLINHVTFRRNVYTLLNISRRNDDAISNSRIIVIITKYVIVIFHINPVLFLFRCALLPKPI